MAGDAHKLTQERRVQSPWRMALRVSVGAVLEARRHRWDERKCGIGILDEVREAPHKRTAGIVEASGQCSLSLQRLVVKGAAPSSR